MSDQGAHQYYFFELVISLIDLTEFFIFIDTMLFFVFGQCIGFIDLDLVIGGGFDQCCHSASAK